MKGKIMNSDEILMRDLPMLDTDRQAMRLEFDNFDDMTMDEFRKASSKRIDELLDFYNRLSSNEN